MNDIPQWVVISGIVLVVVLVSFFAIISCMIQSSYLSGMIERAEKLIPKDKP